MKIIIFALIPLILSMGIAPALQSDFLPEADALKSKGNSLTETGSKKVCGDRLCSETPNDNLYVSRDTAITDLEKQEIESTEIELPPYPDQPDVSPSLLASQNNFLPKQIHSLGEGLHVAVSYDLANAIIIEGENGLIIVDTTSYYENAKEIMTDFKEISDKCVAGIIYTHSHVDHIGGSGAFAEEACEDEFEIYSHESLMSSFVHEFGAAGPAQAIRGYGVFGFDLSDEGTDRHAGQGKAVRFSNGLTTTFVPPTVTFSGESEKLKIAGLDVELYYVKGESPDEIFVWLPEVKAIVPGENIDPAFPNLATIRGSVYRDPMAYVESLDLMLSLEPAYMLPTHANPVSGQENIQEIVTAFRDGTQYVYDQTFRGMNQGKTADELANSITLPDSLKDHVWLQENRGLIEWHVRGIWHGNLGWFEGDTGFLTPVSLTERSERIVEGFGGVDSVLSETRNAMINDNYEWAAELVSYVLYVEPDNEDAKLLKAQALRVLAQRTPAADARNWFLTQALLLEGKINFDQSAFPPTDTTHIPVKYIMKLIPLSVDPVKAQGIDKLVGIEFSDLDESYSVHIRNSIAAIGDGLPNDPDMKITMDSGVFKKIMQRTQTLNDAIDSGDASIDVGTQDDLQTFLAVFDSVVVKPYGSG